MILAYSELLIDSYNCAVGTHFWTDIIWHVIWGII